MNILQDITQSESSEERKWRIRAEAAEERKESDVPPKKTKVTVCLCVKNSVGRGGSEKRQKSEVDVHD